MLVNSLAPPKEVEKNWETLWRHLRRLNEVKKS